MNTLWIWIKEALHRRKCKHWTHRKICKRQHCMNLLLILGDSVILLSKLPLTDKLSKPLIMGDYNKLEVLLAFPTLHYSMAHTRDSVNGKAPNNNKSPCLKVYLNRAAARLSAFGPSRLVVGSSRANMPQFRQNVSASASLIIREASTWTAVVITMRFVGLYTIHKIMLAEVYDNKRNKTSLPSDQHCIALAFPAQHHHFAWQPTMRFKQPNVTVVQAIS